MESRRLAVAVVLAIGLPVVACRPEVAVAISTRLFRDGSVERVVEIRGDAGDGTHLDARDWLASEAKIALAEPDRWDRVDEAPGWLRAEGLFTSVADLPVALAHLESATAAPDRSRIELRRDDLVVATRRRWNETWGDPFGPADADAAIDGLLALARRALHDEMARDLGSDADLSGVDAWLAGEVRDLARALLADRRAHSGIEAAASRQAAFAATLASRGMRVRQTPELDFWQRNADAVLAWAGARLAEAASRPARPVTLDELTFWPASSQELEAAVDDVAARSFGSSEKLWDEAEPLLNAIEGYYASAAAGRFRFELAIELPGRLLRTNGMPDGDRVRWLFRGEDLSLRDVVLEAEAVELDDEALRALGARRSFEPAELLRLVDLLTERDPRGALSAVLRRAVAAGSLAPLEDRDALPDEIEPAARELAELLRGRASPAS